jgi:hypothetical protein
MAGNNQLFMIAFLSSLPCLKPQAGALCYIRRMRFQAKLADLERQFEAKASELRTAYLAEVAEIQAA